MRTMRRLWLAVGLLMAGCLVFAGRAFAQSGAALASRDCPSEAEPACPAVRGGPSLEVTAGYAGFVDEALISHGLLGGLARWPVTPRLSVGPEVTYLWGPDFDRDLFVTGNVTWDFVAPEARRAGVIVPYVVGGAGFFRHSDRFGPSSFASTEGTFTAGGGARVWVTPRVHVGADARVGWELHTRVSGTVGVQLGR